MRKVLSIMKGASIFLLCIVSVVFGDGVEPNNPKCPKDTTIETLLPHKNCNRFYQCVKGNLVLRKCPDNLQFNVDTQKCDWPDRVECGDRDMNADDSQEIVDDGNNEDDENTTADAPLICAKKGSEGTLIAHEYCNKFYKCSGGLPVPFRCPVNLLYNPIKYTCDWPENVSCGNRQIPDIDSNEPDSGSSSDGNNNDGNNNVGNDDPSKAPVICAAEGSDGILIAHEYCNRFYKCSNGLPVPFLCPKKLFYNPSKEICDWKENVNCNNRVVPDVDGDDTGNDSSSDGNDNNDSDGNNNDGNHNVGNDNPSKAPAICAAEGSDGILIAHEYCNRFYKCFNRLPMTFRCPQNLYYNPSKEICDWEENVNCSNRLITDNDSDESGNGSNDNNDSDGNNDDGNINVENDDPSKAPAICAEKGSDGTLIAHEYCNKFYKCSNGLPVVFQCPLNLFYNVSKGQCDWPANVNCGNRNVNDGQIEGNNTP